MVLLAINLFGVIIFPFLVQKIKCSGYWDYDFKPWHQLFHVIEFIVVFYLFGFSLILFFYGFAVWWYLCNGYFPNGYYGLENLRIKRIDLGDFKCNLIFICEKLGWAKTDEEDEQIKKSAAMFGDALDWYDYVRFYGVRITCDLTVLIIIIKGVFFT